MNNNHDSPAGGSLTPNWPYMMKVLYEIWFREHGYNVDITFEPVTEDTPPDAYIVTSAQSRRKEA